MTNTLTTTNPSTSPWLAEIERDPGLNSQLTKESYARALRYFYGWKGDRNITKTLVEEYCAVLHSQGASPSRIKLTLSVLKWWTRKAVDIAYENLPKQRADEIALQAARILSIRQKAVAKGTRLPTGRHIEGDELRALIDACLADLTPAGVRDAAWLAVAIPTGARIDEMLKLTIDDLQYTDTGADVIIQHGKGDKARVVFLSGASLEAMDAWLNLRGAAPGALFCPVLKNQRIFVREMSYEAARQILGKRFQQSGLKSRISWHDFRRTLAGNLFSAGVDVSTIKEQLGHADGTDTKRYDRRNDATRRTAIQNIQVPYQKK